MSRYYPLTRVERYCPSCDGYGEAYGQHVGLASCSQCAGVGRVFVEGGPSFGCKFTLEDAKPGQIVSLGNGDRGRVVRHSKRGTPTTEIALIDPMFDTEDTATTTYPSVTGVICMSVSAWFRDQHGDVRAKQDQLDPLQQQRTKVL